MQTIIGKLSSFFFAVLMLLGICVRDSETEFTVKVPTLTIANTDITEGLEVSVPFFAGTLRFNRISVSYDCTAPVRAVITYKYRVEKDEKTAQEELLLTDHAHEASMLLDGYLQKRTAFRLLSVSFAPIENGRKTTLSVSGFSCDLQAVPKEDVLYLENNAYKAGVKLSWGGGLCYFEDRSSDKYENLLNCHDTGRLVQQSYYGPMEIEGYENGVYSDTVWNYNPVQGGDQYGNTSKLVALEKTEDQIRIVCRPLDWAQNNMPTQTYYTNVYTLTEKGLTVENTAVDFLQTEWFDLAQEIPAFYTISALGTFVFYDGEAPWAGAPLRAESNLDFWGGKPAFHLGENNTETWCAWTDDTQYGIGLYTPIATELLAGRFLYNGTIDANDNPTNYVAPLGIFHLNYNEPFTYTYMLTAGTVGEIRETFSASR